MSIQLDDLTVNNLGMLKTINEKVLNSTTYPESWYKDSLKLEELAKLAFYKELPVGAVRCSIESPQNHNVPTKISITTLAVLKPYRHLGVGAKLVEHIVEQCKTRFVHEVTTHVPVNDAEAIAFFKEQGFEQGEEVKGKDVGDAYLFTKSF